MTVVQQTRRALAVQEKSLFCVKIEKWIMSHLTLSYGM
jgi:hypothetical protein